MMNSFFAPSTLVIQSSLWTLTLPKRLCTGLLPSHSDLRNIATAHSITLLSRTTRSFKETILALLQGHECTTSCADLIYTFSPRTKRRLAELGAKEQQLAAILADLPFTLEHPIISMVYTYHHPRSNARSSQLGSSVCLLKIKETVYMPAAHAYFAPSL